MTDHSNDATAVTDEAIAWLIRLRDPNCSPQEHQQFEAWLSADEAHAREFRSLREIWTASGHLQSSFLPPPSAAGAIRSLRIGALAALLSTLLLVGLLAWYAGWIPSSYTRYASDTKTQWITLPDGSQIELGTDTSISFLRFHDRREIRFAHGEGLLGARAETSAPLQIVVGASRIDATDGQFNIWYDGDRAVVTPVAGSLRLQVNGPDANLTVVDVAAGQQARFSKASPMPEMSSANIERVLAWRQGKLVLSNMPLTDALPLINRHLGKPLQLGDEAAASIRIGGSFSISDMEGLVSALPRIAPVRVVRDGNGNRIIYSAPRRSMK